MGQKIKHHHVHKPKQKFSVERETFIGRKGGPMRDKRDRRNRRDNEWKEELSLDQT